MSTWDEAKEAIANSDKSSSIYIACDSVRYKTKKGWRARYATVVILHMASSRGARIFHNTVVMDDYGNLKMRLMNEVSFALEAAMEVVDSLGERKLEIHLDINDDPKHASNVAAKEALGYVTGSGFVGKIKPQAWAAANAADHVARDKPLN